MWCGAVRIDYFSPSLSYRETQGEVWIRRMRKWYKKERKWSTKITVSINYLVR